MKLHVAATAAALALLPGLAHAQTPQLAADMRCLAAAATIAGAATDPGMKANMGAAALFYLGKLKGRAPGADLSKLAASELPKMTRADLQTESARCSAEMSTIDKEMQAIGAAARAASAPPK